jgi:hypothetical protein
MVRRLDKLPKRKVTMDEILERSDLVESLSDIEQSDPEQFLLLYVKDGEMFYRSNMTNAAVVYHCELMKKVIYADD